MINLPSFQAYGEYSSKNYGLNALQFFTPDCVYWFSYATLVAFKHNKMSHLVIRENKWGSTTGKHLNWIDSDKSKRVDSETFYQLYNQAHSDK